MKKSTLSTFFFYIVTFFLIGIFQISCQKEVEDSRVNNNPPAAIQDSTYLDKLYELYDTGSGLDTQSILTVSYDAQQRISGWVWSDVISGPFVTYKYFYNGVDSIPNQFLMIEYDGTTPDSTFSYFTFDASGRITEDSTYLIGGTNGFRRKTIFKYTYANGKRFGNGRLNVLQPFPSVSNILDTINLDGSGNFLSSVRYNDFNTGTMELYSTANFSYDNKVNPFARQNIYKAHQLSPVGETIFYDYFPFNNMTSHSEMLVTTGTTTFNDDITYIYDANDLPVKATYVDGTDTTVLLYTYKPL